MNLFVTEPEVVLVGKPIIELDGIKTFLDAHGLVWPEFEEKIQSMASLGDDDGEWLVEMAARLCYMSWAKEGKTIKSRCHEDHVRHLIEVGHGACIEHADYHFVVWHISRSLSHEFVRHRLASYSQLSQRYVDSSEVAFIVPPAIQELAKVDPESYRKWVGHCEQSRQLYEELTSKLSDMYSGVESKLERRKMARQAARSVLPNATETKIFVSMNARALRHFVELRANPAADVEIRRLAVKMFRILQDKATLFTHKMEVEKSGDGTESVMSTFRRV